MKKIIEFFFDKQILLLLVAAAIFIFIIWLLYYIFSKKAVREFDNMEGHEFEYYCAELLKKNGFQEVVVTKGSGDFGIDILAERDGITYGIQCKNYTNAVGLKAVQEAYAGKDFYDCMIGVVMSNQYYTGPAMEAAKKLKVLLWDRDYLDELVKEAEE